MPRSALLLLVAVLAVAAVPGERRPDLVVDEATPADLAALTERVWAVTLAAFPARHGCIGDVTVRGDRALGARGRYDPATATVRVAMPRTADHLANALVHEFAHHIEYSCAAHRGLRPVFRRAQGLPPATPWAAASDWRATPSEHWAEATVAYVLRRRVRSHGIHVARPAVATVAAWARGAVDDGGP